jgi:DsbC/DsbD-like thiol-disulfide interchange protein
MSVVTSNGLPALEVTLNGLKASANADIFVETGNSTYFRKPELVSQNGSETVWRLIADRYGDKTPLVGQHVRLTIADGETGLVHEGKLH